MRRRASALWCAVSVAACSFTIDRPPEPPHEVFPDCESAYAKPVLDGVGAAGGGLLMLIAVFGAGMSRSKAQTGALLGALGVATAVTVTFVVASVGGGRKVHACREAQATFRPLPPARQPLPMGTERAPCLDDGTCHHDLTCASDRCVRMPPEHPPDAAPPAPWEPDAGPPAPSWALDAGPPVDAAPTVAGDGMPEHLSSDE